jgi:RNA polymerase sporulation-specific sigma factor
MWTEREVERIMQENVGLVLSLVGRTCRLYPILPSGYDREDLYSLGNIGLLSAARTFDPNRGVAFSTYAYRCIERAISGQLKREWNQQIECVSLSGLSDDEDDNPLEDRITDGTADALAAALNRCDRDLLETVIARLPEPLAQVIWQIYFDGDSVHQVAQRRRLSPQAVLNLQRRALKALRLQLRRLGIWQWDGCSRQS